MKKQFFTLTALLGVSLALASCGGESDLTEASGSIDSATLSVLMTTTAFTDISNAIIPKATGNIAPPLSGLPTRAGLVAADTYDTCTTINGSKTDGSDGDGVPAFYREDYDCSEIPMIDVTGTSSLTGHMSRQDYDDTKYGILGGYMFDFDLTYDQKMSHEHNFGTWSGSWSAVRNGNVLNMISTYATEAGNIPTAQPDLASQWKGVSNFATSYDPTDANLPWQAGTMSYSGFTRFAGQIVYQNQAHSLDVTFKIESTSLTYDRTACAGGYFKDGSFMMTDGAGNKIKYTYVNCTETRTFNGASF